MKLLRNQKGVLAFDFLFGLMIMTGFFILVIMLNFTLSVVESVQYIAFATSRTYLAADRNEGLQKNAAIEKYTQLKEIGVLKSLLRDRWFEMQPPVFNPDRRVGGVRVDFTARALSFSLPFFLGRTGEPNSFRTNVNSYIGREPSMQDCMEYNEQIKEELGSRYEEHASAVNLAPINVAGDNGC